MATKKSPATKLTPDNPENPIQVLKEATCPTSSGKSTLGYQVGADETGAIHMRVSSNDGGGFFSNEWVAFTDIQTSLDAWSAEQGVTSMTFRKIFRGKSANTPGFLIAVLSAEKLIEPMEDKKRVYQACDPAQFLASVEALRKGTGLNAGKKPAAKPRAKAKASPKAKTKAAPKAKKASKPAAKSPRKSPAASRKTK